MLHATKRMRNILLERHLQARVFGIPDGKLHLVHAQVGVDAWESRVGTRPAEAEERAGIEPVGGEGGDVRRGLGRQHAVDHGFGRGSGSGGRRTAISSSGGIDGSEGIGNVQEVSIADMVHIDAEECMRADVAQIVDGQDAIRTQLTLHSDVDLERARRLIYRREQFRARNVQS